MGTIHEPVDQSEAERLLARYRLLSEYARDIMLFVHPDGRIAEANRAAVEAYGYSREELLRLSVFDLRDPAEHATVVRQLAQATAGSAGFETVHRRKDGSTFPVEVNSQSAEIGGERLLFSVVRDVSERRRGEQALRESEERFRTIANAAPALIWISDAENRCTWFNQPWLSFTGRRPEDELGFGWMAGIHPDDLERYTTADRDAFERRVPVSQEFRLRRHDGEYRWILERGEPITGPDGGFAGFAGCCVDITDRRLAEGELKLALAASRAGIWRWDIATGANTWSPENYELYGFDPARGPVSAADWESRIHRDDLPRILQAVRDAVDGRTPEYRAEFRIVHPERGVRWLMGIGRVERAADGTALRITGINLDITDRRDTEARLHQAQRVQSVGRLAGGIAHEVNNLMTVVLGFGNFALEQLEQSHPSRGEIEQMIKAGERAATITRQLLAFTRQQVLRPARLDINAVVTDLSPMVTRALGAEHRLELRLGEGLGAVTVDRAQLEQVLLNLALNSRDAMRGPGTATVTTAMVELEDHSAWRHPAIELHPGRYLVLEVTDTGAGMDEATRSRAFEPFFTTKPVGQGTGLGLSTVYGIVKQSGGYIWLYSEPGLGTSAKVYLPMFEIEPGPTPADPADRTPSARGEVILIAEDEALVRSLARRSLELHGYRVLEASDGRAALEMLERVGGVDLVVSDAVMPQVSGRALGEIVAARWPELPVLYMSGYPGKDVVERGLVDTDAPFIAKPFTPEALARRVREVLDRARR